MTIHGNLFLTTLPEKSRTLILSQATAMPMPQRMSLYKMEQEPAYVYFLTSGMASIVVSTPGGETAEVGVTGNEGFSGSLHLVGPAVISTSAFMQVEGSGLRVPFAWMQSAYNKSDEVRNHVLEFVQQQTLVVSQIAACNRLHEAEGRLARWLLMARSRTGSDVLGITQEFLGMMLGARRTTVSLVASSFQKLGAINYSRGTVTIIDAAKLEHIACDCYQIIKRLDAGLYQTASR